MPVLYVNFKKQDCLEREPYASFLKKYNVIKDDLHGERIELRVGGKDGCFADGFYTDHDYYKNPVIRIDFASVPASEREGGKSVFVRVAYSYESGDDYDLDFHVQRVKEIKKRAPYYYVPGASHFEFSSQMDDEYRLLFDALALDPEQVPRVCCSLISLIISIFSLDN